MSSRRNQSNAASLVPEHKTLLFCKDFCLKTDRLLKVNYMQKCLFLLLSLTMLSTEVWSQANWSPYFMNRDRFVHLNPEQQEKILVKTMEMMVELESKYARQVASTGTNESNHKKFVQHLNSLQNFLIGQAVAADAKSLNELAGLFKDMQSELQGELCIYGGYISRTVSYDGKKGSKKVCTHPATLHKTVYKGGNEKYAALDKKIMKAYVKVQGDKCVAPAKITCNPVIFGYKKAASNEPFCVETAPPQKDDKSKNHNVSSECMDRSLKHGEKEGADSKEVRLGLLTEAMKVSDSAVDNIHSYVFETCVCKDNVNNINTAYKDYIRPHRTCYGMMNTLREVNLNECSGLNAVTTPPIASAAEQWKKFFSEKPFYFKDPARTSKEDKDYFDLIELKEVQALCASSNEVKCEVECSPSKAEKSKDLSCAVKSVTKILSKNGKTYTTVVKDIEPTDYEVKAGEKTFKVSDKEKKNEYECKVPADGPSCNILVEDDKDKAKSKLTLVFSEVKEEPKFTWPLGEALKDDPKVSVAPKKVDEQPVNIEFKVGEKTVSCSAAVPKLDAVKYSILAGGTPEGPGIRVKAVETPKRPEGAYISWSREGQGVALLQPVVAKPKPAPVPNDAGSVQDDTTIGKETAPVDLTPKGEVAQGDEILEARVGADYKACAVLRSKEGAVLSEAKSCVTIPAISAGPVNLNNITAPPRFIAPANLTLDGIR